MFFFFQAEDGIRDGRVTGVQTCALPICLDELLDGAAAVGVSVGHGAAQLLDECRWRFGLPGWLAFPAVQVVFGGLRSEERRVGKECRSGWSPQYYKITQCAVLVSQRPGR